MAYIGNSQFRGVGVVTGGNIQDGSIESLDLATLTNIDVNGGSIDGAIIGANEAVAGTFSTLKSTYLALNDGSDAQLTISTSGTGDTTFLANNGLGTNGTYGQYIFLSRRGSNPTLERMRIDASGNLLVGTDTYGGAGGTSIEQNGTFRSILSAGTGGDTLIGAVSGVSNGYQITVDTSNTQEYKWHSGGSRVMTLTNSGDLLVGKTSTNFGTDGVEIKNDQIWSTNTSSDCLSLNRKTANGNLTTFYKDGSIVGSIGTNGSHTYFVGNDSVNGSGCGLLFEINTATPVNRSGTPYNGLMNLGSSSNKFRNLYLDGDSKANGYIFEGNKSDPTGTTATMYDRAGTGLTTSSLNFTVRTGTPTPSESMRVDSSGNLLVGATSSIWGTSGRGVIENHGSASALNGLVAGSNRAYTFLDGANLSLWNEAAGSLTFGTNNTSRVVISNTGAITTTQGTYSIYTCQNDGNEKKVHRLYFVAGASGVTVPFLRIRKGWWGSGSYVIRFRRTYHSTGYYGECYIDGPSSSSQYGHTLSISDSYGVSAASLVTIGARVDTYPGNSTTGYQDVSMVVPAYTQFYVEVEAVSTYQNDDDALAANQNSYRLLV